MRILIALLVAGTVLGAGPAIAAGGPEPVEVPSGNTRLKALLYRPEGNGPFPAVIVLHTSSGLRPADAAYASRLADEGYVCLVPDFFTAYGLSQNTRRDTFTTHAQAIYADFTTAIDTLKKTEGVRADRIGAVGFSAGAHLSMLLGTMDKDDGCEGEGGNPDQPSKVNAVVAWFGPTDLTTPDWPDRSGKLIVQFCGGTKQEKPDVYKKASPLTYVNAGDAPTLLIQGTKDVLVPWTQATYMADALTKAGVYGRVDLIVGANHGWGGDELKRTADETWAFFERFLKAKKK